MRSTNHHFISPKVTSLVYCGLLVFSTLPEASLAASEVLRKCSRAVAEPLKKSILWHSDMAFPPKSADPFDDIGVVEITSPYLASRAARLHRSEGGAQKTLPTIQFDIRTEEGLKAFSESIAKFREILDKQKEAKKVAKSEGLPKPKFEFNISGKTEAILENIEHVLESLSRLEAQDHLLGFIRKEVRQTPDYLNARRHLIIALDRLATGLTRNYSSPIPPDNSIGQVLKLGLFTKLGLYSPGRVPLKGELWGLRKDQKVPPGEEWRLDPVDGIIWSSKNVATPQDNLYQPPMSSRELFINATDIIPKTGFGAHFGVSGEINATFKSASGELVHLPVAIGKFRIGNSDTSRIEHRGESQTGPVGVSFVKSLGFNSADISFFGNLMIANNEPGAIRHLFKTANIRSEFGWILRAWTSGPIIPFTQSLTSNRQKYYNPFTVITKVILKDGREITDWREFQKQYFTGDPKTLTKAQKGEQRDENYNIEFENQIAYVEIGPMSVEILPPKKRKDLKKHRKAIKKIQEDLEEGLLTTYETDAQTLLNSVRSKAARYNLYSLDVNSNAYHSHRAVRGLLPLIAMLQAWDIRPENLRVSVYVYKNGKQRISVRFSDWGSILGKAVGFTGNTNADPNRYPLDIITKSGKDWRGRPRIVLNVQGNSISKAALHADYDSIKWGFSQIGRLTKDQIFQIIGSGQFSSAYTYAMAMKFMMARDKALEILFTRKEIESEFGGFLAVANGQRVIDPTTLQFSSTADLPIEHNGRVIATMKSDGTYVKDGIYYKANGEIHDPAVEKK